MIKFQYYLVTSSDIYNEQFWNQKDIPPPKKKKEKKKFCIIQCNGINLLRASKQYPNRDYYCSIVNDRLVLLRGWDFFFTRNQQIQSDLRTSHISLTFDTKFVYKLNNNNQELLKLSPLILLNVHPPSMFMASLFI